MGDFLNQQGYTCLGIRLAGHATNPYDMIRSRWTNWTASVEDGYHLLRGVSDEVFLIGLSMGGNLSLLMSTRLDVRGVVAMATPNSLPVDYPLWLMRLISTFMKFRSKGSDEPGSGWFDTFRNRPPATNGRLTSTVTPRSRAAGRMRFSASRSSTE